MGNGGYPGADLKLRQNSKFLNFVVFFNFCPWFKMPQVAQFPTTNVMLETGLDKSTYMTNSKS